MKEKKEPELPVVTVVVPNYNYSKWVLDALNSIVVQDYPKKAIVFIDDHSTDQSFEKVNSCIQIEDSLKIDGVGDAVIGTYSGIPITSVFLEQNGGPARTRNIGAKLAWGVTHIFGFLDSDDLYLPGKISKSVSIFLSDPEVIGAVYSDYDTHHTETGLTIREFKESFSRERLVQECIVNNDSLVTKLALDKCGLYDETMRTCEDYDLWMRVSERFLIVHIPQALVQVRVTGKGATFSVTKEEWNKNWQKVMQKAQERINAGNSTS